MFRRTCQEENILVYSGDVESNLIFGIPAVTGHRRGLYPNV